MIDRKLLSEIDWVLVGILVLNSALGCLLIYSASGQTAGSPYLRQAVFILISLVALFLVLSPDYKILAAYSPSMYALGLLALAALLLWGRLISGTKSWFRVASLGLQPSELMKVFLILLLARLFAEFRRQNLSVAMFLLSGCVVGLPFVLVVLQPDLGTAASYLPLLFAAFFLAGLNRRQVVALLILVLAAGLVGWNFILNDYQKTRLVTLVAPGHDPQGVGYQIQQSKIAIGSGGMLGKGFRQGSQSQLNFLPARHTDFIFSVLGEEFGFLGILVAIASYFLLLLRLFQTVNLSSDRMGIYIVFQVAVLLSFQFLVNVLMVIGLFPVAGIPLPLFSYGGSSLLTTYLCVGLVLNVRMRRFANV
jgi:rod shape determining protein RodA